MGKDWVGVLSLANLFANGQIAAAVPRCRLRWASAAANRGDCDGGVQQLIGLGGRVIGLGGIPLTHPQDHFLQVLMPHL